MIKHKAYSSSVAKYYAMRELLDEMKNGISEDENTIDIVLWEQERHINEDHGSVGTPLQHKGTVDAFLTAEYSRGLIELLRKLPDYDKIKDKVERLEIMLTTHLWTVTNPNGLVKVLIRRGLPLVVGDKCMFYSSISEVLGIQNPEDPADKQIADVESDSCVSKEDAKMFKNMKAGEWGRMKHGFSTKNLPKILGCTDPTVGVAIIDYDGEFINDKTEENENS